MLELSTGSWWLVLGVGLAAGVLSGALGLGSGILLVPALVLLCDLPQKTAQGTALAVMVPMVLVGAIRYKFGTAAGTDLQLVALMAMGAVVGALVGSEIALRLPAHILRKAFAVFMCVAAIKMFITPGKKPPSPVPSTTERTDTDVNK